MKKVVSFSVLAILGLVASGCGAPASASSSQLIDAVNTAVAMTATAQSNLASPTPTASPTPSPAEAPTSAPSSGQTPTSTPLPASSYYPATDDCNDSSFIKDVTISDGTVLTPGEEFTKTWKLENTGTCTWNSGYSLIFSSGYEMSGSSTGIDQTVNPGKKANVSVDLVAPDSEGTYYGYWTLEDQYGYTFGATVYVEIVVAESTSTPTATPTSMPATATPTASPSATPTAAPTKTSTPAPTSTPTSTPVSTSTVVATATLEPTSTPTATAVPPATATPTATPTHAD